MRIFVDGQAVEEANGWSIHSVGELVQRLGKLPALTNRVIQSISVDGLELRDWDVHDAVELSQNAQVHVRTQTVVDLLASAVQSAKEYVPHLEAGAVQAATLLQEGRRQDAFGVIGQLVEGLQWYSEFLGSLMSLVPQEQRRSSERLAALGAIMTQVLESWEGQDHTLLADLLEYELSSELRLGLDYVEDLLHSRFPSVSEQ